MEVIDQKAKKPMIVAGTKSAKALRAAIAKFPADEPRNVAGVWYRTQKQHWLGWLDEYESSGAYGRKGRGYDARFAYSHIVEFACSIGSLEPQVSRRRSCAEPGQPERLSLI